MSLRTIHNPLMRVIHIVGYSQPHDRPDLKNIGDVAVAAKVKLGEALAFYYLGQSDRLSEMATESFRDA